MQHKRPHRRPRRTRPAPEMPAGDELAPQRAIALDDRRDTPAVVHANIGPDDRSSLTAYDIEEARAERPPEIDAAVIERDASDVRRP